MMPVPEWLQRIMERLVGRQAPIAYTLGLPSLLGASGNVSEAYLRAYGELGWLFACVSRIASSIGETEWRCVQQVGKAERFVETSPALTLLAKPNPFWTGQELLELTQMHLDLVGEAFWVLNTTRAGLPGEIWPVPPQRIRILTDPKNYIAGYEYRYGAQTVRFLPDQIVHFRYPSPLDMYRGLGPVQSLAIDLDSELFASKWNRNLFLNSARPDAVIETTEPLSEEQYKEFQRLWQAEFQGVDKAHRIGLLRKGMIYKRIALSQEEMSFVEQRKLNRDIILGAFGMPLHILGIAETTNRATAESAEYVYARWVLRPRLQRLMRKINAGLVAKFGQDSSIRFVDPTPENRDAARLDAQIGVTSGYMTVNEARASMGLEVISIGDVLLWGLATSPTPAELAKSSERNARPVVSTLFSSPSMKRLPSFTKTFSDEQREQIGDLFLRRLSPREQQWKSAMIAFYKEQEQAIVEALETLLKERQIGAELYDEIKWLNQLRRLGKRLLIAILQEAGDDAVSDYKLGISFNLSNPHCQKWIGNRIKEFSTNVSDTQKKAIAEQLQQAEIAGESIPQMIERIKQHYGGKEYMAERVARTEVVYGSNQGALEAFGQAGVERWQWLITEDERTCETCIALDGGIHLITTAFEPPHPNCRCTVLPIIPEPIESTVMPRLVAISEGV